MGRKPYNVHVLLFRESGAGRQFALFKRADIEDVWQGVCGGGESGESIAQAAIRECYEEAGVESPGMLYPLDATGSMSAEFFTEWTPVWGPDVLVLPMYHFAMEYDGDVRVSEEHSDFGWFFYEDGVEKMRFGDQRLALWELNERLERGNLNRPLPEALLEVAD